MAELAIQVRFEQPVNLRNFTRDFTRKYIDTLNREVSAKSQEFADLFRAIHEEPDGTGGRSLSPVFTDASGRSVAAYFTPISENATVLAGKTTLQVGYFPKAGRTPLYVPAIEGGWLGGVGKNESLRGQQIGRSLFSQGNDNRKTKIPKSLPISVRPDNAAEARLRRWASQKLGIPVDGNKRKWPRDVRARYYALKRKVFNEGAPGRNVVHKYGTSPQVRKLWEQVNTQAGNTVSQNFRVTQADKRVLSATLVRAI